MAIREGHWSFRDMCAPEITFLPALSTLNLHRADSSVCGMADMLESRKMGLWLRKAFPLHYSDGQSSGPHTHTHTHAHTHSHTSAHTKHSSASTNQTAVRHYVSSKSILSMRVCVPASVIVIFMVNVEVCTTGAGL